MYSFIAGCLKYEHISTVKSKAARQIADKTPQQPVQYVTCVGDYRSPMGMISSLIKNSMVSSSQSSTLLSSSSVSTPTWHKNFSTPNKKPQRQVNSEITVRGPTSSELEANALLFLINLLRLLPVPSVVFHHCPALVHQLLLTQSRVQHHNPQSLHFSVNTQLVLPWKHVKCK